MKKDLNIIAIGNFDGLHAGHQKLLEEVKKKGDQHKILALTFDPHPKLYFNPEFSLISTKSQKEELIKANGIEEVIFWDFSKIVDLSPLEFVQFILINQLRVKEVVVGHDFYFGKNRSGSIKDLKQFSERFGFKLSIIPSVIINQERVSSSYIRKLLSMGKVDDQIGLKMLTRFYHIDGMVIKGEGIGKVMGFPTINLRTDNKIIPLGVFETILEYNKKKYKSITNIGFNPTFNRGELAVETYIINFMKNLYNKQVRVHFIRKIRDEKKFLSRENLIAQIKRDLLKIKSK